MKTKIKTLKERVYKGQVLREVETEYGCVFVLVDNDSNEVENAPAKMQENEYTYASFADAKRCINGEPMVYVMGEADYLGDKYFNRFNIG